MTTTATTHDQTCTCHCDWCNMTDTPCRRCEVEQRSDVFYPESPEQIIRRLNEWPV